MNQESFDIVVIGAGPGGEAAAVHAVRAGASVALIERELVGGECPYWGCMPSKALLRPPHVLAEAQRTPGAAEAVTGALDIDAVLARRDEVVRGLDDTSHAERMTQNGITLLRGHGELTGERLVAVTDADGTKTELHAEQAVIVATGSRAAIPPIDGLAEARPWTNREATLATTIPPRLAIIGGGVIGVELAQAFASYGSHVTVLEAGDHLLAREEPEAAALVAAALRRTGVTIHTGTKVERVERDAAGAVHIHSNAAEAIVADEVLVAVGRQGNVEGLGLERVGVTPGRSGIVEVCDCMHVDSAPWLYVVGDLNGRAQLTHTAAYQARVAARNAVGVKTHCVDDNVAAPRVVFTEPNLSAVGHTRATATEAGLRIAVFDRDPQRVAAGSFSGRGTEGFARCVVDLDSGCIVGATIVGSDLAELLHASTIAIVGKVPVETLRHCVAPFPTRSEVWTKWLDAMEREPELWNRQDAARGER